MTARFLVNHLWQSSCFALLAGLLAGLLRGNSPKVRYWVWLSASLKFLVPFALLVNLGSVVPRPARAVAPLPAAVFPDALTELATPFFHGVDSSLPAHNPLEWVAVTLAAVWALGFLAIAAARWRAWLRIRESVGAGTPVELPISIPARIAPGAGEPGVAGVLKPVLILPAGLLERLDPRQRDAILAHEMCHVRRRDNLFATIHMAVEAIFWFDPLVWWIGFRLVEERERACDEEVLRLGCEPADYVEGMLKVCGFYPESGLPCVSGVTSANVKERLRTILLGKIAAELSWSKKLVLALAAAAAVAAPIAVGMLEAPAVRAQTTSDGAGVRSAAAQPIRGARPVFEVASIRPCTKADEAALADVSASAGGRGGGGAGNLGDAGNLRLLCRPLAVLIAQAYLTFANGEFHRLRVVNNPVVEGGPAWIRSERYTIQAKPQSPQSRPMMAGPMMQALLEDRFQLKIHRASKTIPAYALVVGQSGPKLPLTKGCPADMPQPPPPRAPGQPAGCNYQRFTDAGIDTYGWTMANLADVLGPYVNRIVIDKTGMTGAYDFHLDLPAPPSPDQVGNDALSDLPSAVMDSLKKVGLKLEEVKDTAEFVVIDHVERPTEN